MSGYRLQKCSICCENEALIFVKVMVRDKIEEKGLCAQCAIKYMENKGRLQKLDLIDRRVADALEEMKSLLTSIVSNISIISTMMQSKNGKNSLKCGNCDLLYDDFKESGYFGCPYCYSYFKEQISDILLELERGSIHRGKMPKKYAGIFLLKKEIHYLKNQLKKSIHSENYEQADKIKKKLDKLTGNHPVGKEDEIY